MLHSLATLASCVIVAGVLTLIALILVDDWATVMRAIGVDSKRRSGNPPLASRPTHDRHTRIASLSSRSVPRRAAA